MRHKGKQHRSVLTSNGRVKLSRIRWSAAGDVRTPLDTYLDAAEETFSRGVQEMLCRLDQRSPSFAKTAAAQCVGVSHSREGLSARQVKTHERERNVVADGWFGKLAVARRAGKCGRIFYSPSGE